MYYKGIFKGALEFGSERSYSVVKDVYFHKFENLYKGDVMLKSEQMFDDETFSVSIPHIISQGTEKSFKNTVGILNCMAEYAVAGQVMGWMTAEGNTTPIYYQYVEPKGDKSAIQAYLQGKSTLAEGKVEEAKDALTTAIERFARHALAYERRGYVNIKLKNYTDALYDYNKSIAINPHHSDAYYGRAIIKVFTKDYAGAIEDLDLTIKKTFPLQPMYWQARNMKGECHMQLKDYVKAAFEYKFFTRREYKETDPNFKKRKLAFSNYGKALVETGDYQEAVVVINKALAIEDSTLKLPFDLLECKEIAVKHLKAMPPVKALKRPKPKASR